MDREVKVLSNRNIYLGPLVIFPWECICSTDLPGNSGRCVHFQPLIGSLILLVR